MAARELIEQVEYSTCIAWLSSNRKCSSKELALLIVSPDPENKRKLGTFVGQSRQHWQRIADMEFASRSQKRANLAYCGPVKK